MIDFHGIECLNYQRECILALMIQNNNKMNHTEAIQEIIKVAPESEEEFKEIYKTKNSFMVINVFTKQIQKLIKKKDKIILINCLNKMNEIYRKGDHTLKNAVESIFIYSLDSMIFSCDQVYKNLIFEKIPVGLQKAYFRQVYKSGL
ncbi:hypothetical protein SAMN05444371_3157 [Epilithonimonas mollis]|uniref:DUF7674 domain-containing protein n=2 Tax=Epilithonimonas mollis TaxID=216903 RepID=A0A1M6U6F6_9FLAO|nr:hypothetical protein SAMN05444371_3157 [Epilithonimonas mollis]